MDCLHEGLESTGCRFKWWCKNCNHWISIAFGLFDPCVKGWCENGQCHNYHCKMNSDKTIFYDLAQWHNSTVIEAIKLGAIEGRLP